MRKVLPIICFILWMGNSFGQLTGNKTIPGDYASLTLAISDLNSLGVGAGGVTFTIDRDYTETLPSLSAGLITATGTAANPIVFQRASGTGANPLITAAIASSATTDGIIKIAGGDYITFDGIDLRENPANTTNRTEWGYALVKASSAAPVNGCQYVTIRNCTISLNKSTANSFGIYAGNHIATNNTFLTLASPTDAMNNCKFYGNTISNCAGAFSLSGWNTAPSPYTLYDQNNEIGVTDNNYISNCGLTSASIRNIYAIYQNNLKIAKNNITCDATGATTTVYGIFTSTGNNSNIDIFENTITITMTTGAFSSTMYGIANNTGGSGTNNTIKIYNNTVQNCLLTSTSTGAFVAIVNQASGATVNMYGNTISGNVTTGNGDFTGINQQNGMSTYSLNVYNNSIYNNRKTSTTGNMYLIRGHVSSASVHDNIIHHDTLSGSGSIYGYFINSAAVTESIYSNDIYSLSQTGTGSVYGIQMLSTVGVKNTYDNQVYNLTAANGNVYGIAVSFGAPHNIYKNNVFGLTGLGLNSEVGGIRINAGTTMNIYNNFISDLNAPVSSNALAISGIGLNGGTTGNVSYNTVYLKASSTATNFGTSGIYKSSTTTGEFKNNNIVNLSTPGTISGLTVAYRISGTYNPAYYSSNSNGNNFFAGTPGPTQLIFSDGASNVQTIESYQGTVSPADGTSFSEEPPFINDTVAPYDLRINETVASKCESGGVDVAGITDDFFGNLRHGDPNYTGTGTAPDVGADEFEGIPVYTCATPDPGNTLISETNICFGKLVTFSLQKTISGTGNSFQWQSSSDNVTYSDITGAISNTYSVIPDQPLYYRCMVTCQNGPETAYSVPIQVVFASNITAANHGTRCGTGVVNLSASGTTGNINWYHTLGDIAPFHTGTTYTTPVLTSSTAYYVSDVSSQSDVYGARLAPGTTSGGTPSNYGLVFNVTTALTLESVDVYPSGSDGLLDIQIQNSAGVVLHSITGISIPAGTGTTAYSIPVDFYLPVGNGYRLVGTSGTAPLVRETSLGGFPYNLGTAGVVTSGFLSGSTNTTYYFFYNWRVSYFCESPRIAINATVTPAPTLTVSATPAVICQLDSSDLLVTSTNDPGYTYTWEPGSMTGATQTVNPMATTTYIVEANDYSSGLNAGCYIKDSVTLTVNPIPTATVVTPSVATLAAGAIQQLTATGGELSGVMPKTWSPLTYLYTDALATLPYTGTALATVYTKPMASIVYTATSTTGAGCTTSATVTITNCPPAPAPVTISSIRSNQFSIAWPSVQGEHALPLEYTVEVTTDAGYTNHIAGSPATLTDPDTNRVFAGLVGNTTYYYRVKATGDCASAYTSGSMVTCPDVPGVVYTSDVSDQSLIIHWSSAVGGNAEPVDYTIEVSTDNLFTSPIVGSPFTETDTSLGLLPLSPNNIYYYRLTANNSCSSDYTGGQDTTCPAVPGTLAHSELTSGGFKLTWTSSLGEGDKNIVYVIDVCTDPVFSNPIVGSPFLVNDPTLELTVSGLEGNTKYYYRIVAVGACESNAASGSLTTCTNPPAGLTAANITDGSFDILWESPTGGGVDPVDYIVDVTTDAGFSTHIVNSPFSLSEPDTSLSLTGLNPNTQYYFRIKSMNGCSSNYSTGSAITCPDVPGSLTASNVAYTEFDLSWTSSIGGNASPVTYKIDVTSDPGFTTHVASSPYYVNDPGLSLYVGGLTSATTYYYQITAQGSCNSLTADGSLTTLTCHSPSAFTTLPTSGNTVYMSWNAASTPPPLGYKYEVRISGLPGSGPVGLIASGTTDALFKQITGLTPSTAYTAYLRSECDPFTTTSWLSSPFTTLTCTTASIPYLENFDSYTPPTYGCLTVEDVNSDGVTWYTATGPTHSGTKKMTILKSLPPDAQDDWMFTHGLPMIEGRVYNVSFWYRSVSPSYMEKMEVKFGLGPFSQFMTSPTIWSSAGFNNNVYVLGTATLTAPATGVYWLGFHAISDFNKAGIFLDDVAVCEGPAIVDPISGPAVVCKPATGISYSVPPISGTLSYTWTVPSGATITGGLNTNSITVEFGQFSESGDVTVYGTSTCGVGNIAEMAVTVGVPTPVSITVNASQDPVCDGTTVNFTTSVTNGGTAPAYEWRIDGGPVVGTDDEYSYIPVAGDTVSCSVTSDVLCATNNPASGIFIPQVNVNLPVSVTIDADVDTICEGSTVLLTATPVNGGSTPQYQWQLNDQDISGATDASYSSGAFQDGDVVKVLLTSSESCQTGSPASSNEITITVFPNLPVSVSLSSNDTIICDGTQVTFTATPANGGLNPQYEWFLNNLPVAGNTGNTYVTDTLVNGDAVKVILTSSETCQSGGPATSGTITMTVNPNLPVSVSISANDTSVCDGTNVQFTASPVNGGVNPQYQWQLNDLDITGATDATYSASTLADGDEIKVVLTSSEECTTGNPDTSDPITLIVYPNLPVSVGISANDTSVCDGATVLFTATPVNGGVNPQYQWKLNGDDISGATDATYSTNALADSDTVAVVLTSSEACQSGGPATSDDIVMTIYPNLPVSVTIDADNNPVCVNTQVTFTATPVNGGSNPGYQWFVNDLDISGATSATFQYTPADQDTVYCVLTSSEDCKTGSPAISDTIVMTVNQLLPVSVTISANDTSVCDGTLVQFTATPVNGGNSPQYQWVLNNQNIAGATNATYSSDTLNNGDLVHVVLTSSEVCQSGGPASSADIAMIIYPNLPVSVSIVANDTSVCDGTQVQFTATPVNGGNTPQYQWKVNNLDVNGETNSTFTSATLQNNDVVKVVLTSSEACQSGGPATSAGITMVVYPNLPVSVSISANDTSVCDGTLVQFTATPVNGGTSPQYQWVLNSQNITGATNATYSSDTLNNGDMIHVVLTSSESCQTGGPATSPDITMIVYPNLPVSVSIIANDSSVCEGTEVQFTATPVNGGSTPQYQWKVNNLDISGATTSTFASTTLQNNDIVKVVLTSSEACKSGSPATSGEITMTIFPNLPVSVSIEADNDTVCDGTLVEFTATPTNGGTSPQYQWRINNLDQSGASNSTFTTSTLVDGDVVTVVLTSSEACQTGGPATSNAVVMQVNPILPVSVSIEVDADTICAGTLVEFTATPVNGGANPYYQWFVNEVEVIGVNGATFSADTLKNGDVIKAMLTSSEACKSGSPATSNEIVLVVNPILTVSVIIEADDAEVCAGTLVTFTATPDNGGSNPMYQWKVNNLDISGATNNIYAYVPNDQDTVTCLLTSTEVCVADPEAISNAVIVTMKPHLPVSVSLALDLNQVCAGTTVHFTATPTNGGTAPVYQWFVNEVEIIDSVGPTFSYIPSDLDEIYCSVNSNEECAIDNPAYSLIYTMTVYPLLTVDVSITASADSVCAGTSVTYTANPVNGGSAPQYAWYHNGPNPVSTDPTYTCVPAEGESIEVFLTSSEQCISGSNVANAAILPVVYPNLPVSVEIISDAPSPLCAGTEVQYTANVTNGGNAPQFAWSVNGGPVAGTNATFSYTPQDGDEIAVTAISSEVCTTGNPASDTDVATVYPVVNVEVQISVSANPVYNGLPVTFTAVPTNPGSAPVYQWFVNGAPVGSNSTTYSYTPSDGDMVYCSLTNSDPCTAGNPAISDTIEMSVSLVPVQRDLRNIVVHDQEVKCYDAQLTLVVAGPGYTFTMEPGSTVTMISGKWIFMKTGTTIKAGSYLHAYISDQFCGQQPDNLVSNVLGEEEIPFMTERLAFKVYPNPTSGNFTLEQKPGNDFSNLTMEVYGMRGERIITEKIIGEKQHEVRFADYPAGLYFIKVIAGDYVETIKLIKNR